MVKRSLLILPSPQPIAPPRGHGGGSQPRLPNKPFQIAQYGPAFSRLREVFAGRKSVIELRNDPTSLAPDRAIVFEIAGTIPDFLKAAKRIPGLEIIAESEVEFSADENFATIDKRKGKEGLDRTDVPVDGRFYLAMPDVEALKQLVSLWERWRDGRPLDGFAPFTHLFEQLHGLRTWGAKDRITDEAITFWKEEASQSLGLPVRTEVELWFRQSATDRKRVSSEFAALLVEVGGTIVHEIVIPEIAYHGALIDIPFSEIDGLIHRRAVLLALADDVMFLRPQSTFACIDDNEPVDDLSLSEESVSSSTALRQPIAALLDGVPVQGHSLLANRLLLDDPDDLQSRAIVSGRLHGTAMASLIVHGDLNTKELPLTRPLYVRPLLLASREGAEHSDPSLLLVDTIYRAKLRMKGGGIEEGAAPTVFLVNLSIGDARRPFTQLISPLARVIDYLSEKYSLLFLVSAGNISAPLEIEGFTNWSDFETALSSVREKAVLSALNSDKHQRSILSPAESLNSLTIGAQHHDSVPNRTVSNRAVDPFEDRHLPNVSSALGLGYRRAVKPEIYFPGGREHLRMTASGAVIKASIAPTQRTYGLSAAAPDPTGQGRTNYTSYSDGTSSATALATRSAHLIFDALLGDGEESVLADMPPNFYAVTVKALLLHSSRWRDNAEVLKEVCGPTDKKRHVERSENASRFIGFGVPDIAEVIECSSNRATLIGYDSLMPDHAHCYKIPLPPSLERVTEPRSLSITIAWLSPIKPGHQSYRCVRLEATPLNNEPVEAFGVERRKQQPSDAIVKRGSIFHERYYGDKAIAFIDDGHLNLVVWCKQDAGGIEDKVRYCIVVTIEAGINVPVYDEIELRLRVQTRSTV
ncbi:S8 family peptidase [Massilia antarctica]|uniref:S8 family peptidase n=1 Tax=Massilia antarctica TaxID=2765360 RepID=A0AA49A661_9BURK|nr:S8 family peptidase [Massilia antarctica]QPI47806.1 S8 family peptidase [Massilia antarctica]